MAKKEKLEDIDVMEGINFEKNQNRMRRLNARIKREKRIRTTLYILIVVMIMFVLLLFLDKSRKEAYKSCVENGMSTEWCEVHTR
jgi:hypothetical protein